MRLTLAQLNQTATEAHDILDVINEDQYAIRQIARITVDNFISTFNTKMELWERIDLAVELTKEQLPDEGLTYTSGHRKCARALAERVIVLSGRIVKRGMTQAKAIKEIDDTIAARNKQWAEREIRHRRPEFSRSDVQLWAMDGINGSSPKPRVHKRAAKPRRSYKTNVRRRAA